MAVFTLEDAQGSIEVIAFPETFQRAAALIEPGVMVVVSGKIERGDEVARIVASEIISIDGVRERVAREVAIHLRMPAQQGVFEALGEIFSRYRGDRRVSFEIELPRDRTPLRLRAAVSAQIRVRPSSSFVSEVERIVGPGSVSLR
jgi:DNA polymerase-3 subunit alpha